MLTDGTEREDSDGSPPRFPLANVPTLACVLEVQLTGSNGGSRAIRSEPGHGLDDNDSGRLRQGSTGRDQARSPRGADCLVCGTSPGAAQPLRMR